MGIRTNMINSRKLKEKLNEAKADKN